MLHLQHIARCRRVFKKYEVSKIYLNLSYSKKTIIIKQLHMPSKISSLLWVLLSTASFSFAQELLNVDAQKRCVYSGKMMDAELYRFPNNEKVTQMVKEIRELSEAENNFELVQTNVENVSAVMAKGKRYLLYSLDFIEKGSSLEIYGALSHEIGHHTNGHTFNENRRKIEETEADVFMGFILSKKGFSQLQITGFLNKMPSSYNILNKERNENVYIGYNKANISIEINSNDNSLPWDNDDKSNSSWLPMPRFPFPPPSCYSRFEIPSTVFNNMKLLGDVDNKLRSALDNKGYTQRSYFYVPNGFALVTQLEQYNAKDATIRNDGTRWLDYPKQEGFSGIMSYISSFIMPNKGYFRLFVFIVTNEPFGGSKQKVSKSEASAWLNQGFNKLPNAIKNAPYTEGYAVTVLVYEFEVPESNRKAKQVCPTPLFDAQTHLKQAGIGMN